MRNKAGDYQRPTPRQSEAKPIEKAETAVPNFAGGAPGGGYGGAGPPAKRKKSESLLDIWSRRVEKENSHIPYAGQQTFGEVAKLYLNMDRKEESKE